MSGSGGNGAGEVRRPQRTAKPDTTPGRPDAAHLKALATCNVRFDDVVEPRRVLSLDAVDPRIGEQYAVINRAVHALTEIGFRGTLNFSDGQLTVGMGAHVR